jgi:hypothetical protein
MLNYCACLQPQMDTFKLVTIATIVVLATGNPLPDPESLLPTSATAEIVSWALNSFLARVAKDGECLD